MTKKELAKPYINVPSQYLADKNKKMTKISTHGRSHEDQDSNLRLSNKKLKCISIYCQT